MPASPVSRGTTLARHPAPPILATAALLLAALLLAASAFRVQAAFAAPEDENRVDPTQRADNSFIYDTSIESLYGEASLYDGKTVQVVGEVIGDRIAASEEGQCWITLTVTDTEDKTSISVLLPDEQASQIDRYGKYGVTGTIFKVRGIFHQTCVEHDGLSDIHATYSEVQAKGVDHPDEFDPYDFGPGVVVLIIGALLMTTFHFARERMR